MYMMFGLEPNQNTKFILFVTMAYASIMLKKITLKSIVDMHGCWFVDLITCNIYNSQKDI